MSGSPGGFKFMYAFFLPAILIAAAVVGADSWNGYRLIATALILIGAVCAARVARSGSNRYAVGVVYMVVIELLMLFLP